MLLDIVLGMALYPTCVNIWLRAMLMVRDVRVLEWSFIWFQNLGLSGEIPRVVFDSPETDHGLYVLLVVGVMLWAAPRWIFGLFISPCELILGVIAMDE